MCASTGRWSAMGRIGLNALRKKGPRPPWAAGRGGAVVIAMFGRLNSPGQEISVSGIEYSNMRLVNQ
jgi:hypothetical protein